MTILALSSRTTIALTVAIVLLLIGGLLYVTARGEIKGKRKARIPAAMRPGSSDADLEKSVIERYLLVGALTALGIAIWMPLYWLKEPSRLAGKQQFFLEREVAEGQDLYLSLCSTCHGQEAQGSPRTVFIDGKQFQYAEPPLKYAYSRYRQAGRNEEDITQLLHDAIARGRPGTPMPTWSLAYGGPLNSAQVENIMLWLQSIQEDFPKPDAGATGEQLFAANCAICHGKEGQGAIGPNLQVAFDRLTREQVRTAIHEGRLNTNRPSMPAWAGLGDRAIEKLIDFIASIQKG
ncbi:MAG: c-type cytochrome [Actinomycetota bacterium]